MEKLTFFTPEERIEFLSLYKELRLSAGNSVSLQSVKRLKETLINIAKSGVLRRTPFNANPILHAMRTAYIVSEEVGIKAHA